MARTFEGIFSTDVVGRAIQALDGANHDGRRRLGRAEADGQEQSESTEKNQPSPHDGRTLLLLPLSAVEETLVSLDELKRLVCMGIYRAV